MSSTANVSGLSHESPFSLRCAIRRGIEYLTTVYLGLPRVSMAHLRVQYSTNIEAETEALNQKFEAQVACWDDVIEQQALSLVEQSRELLSHIQAVDRLVPIPKTNGATHLEA